MHQCLIRYLQHVLVVEVARNRVCDFVCDRWLRGPEQLSLTEGLHVHPDCNTQPYMHRYSHLVTC